MALYDAFIEGAVRTAALLKAQTPEATAAIRRAVREASDRTAGGVLFELPMAAVLSSAATPSR